VPMRPFGSVCDHFCIHIFPQFGLYQEKSGNPGTNMYMYS
jgi:hypothetical protein